MTLTMTRPNWCTFPTAIDGWPGNRCQGPWIGDGRDVFFPASQHMQWPSLALPRRGRFNNTTRITEQHEIEDLWRDARNAPGTHALVGIAARLERTHAKGQSTVDVIEVAVPGDCSAFFLASKLAAGWGGTLADGLMLIPGKPERHYRPRVQLMRGPRMVALVLGLELTDDDQICPSHDTATFPAVCPECGETINERTCDCACTR